LKLKELIEEFRPDLIFACSDAIHIVIGKVFCNIFKLPLIVDLYDNYESFGLTRIPGIYQLFRSAIKRADGIVCVSRNLAEYIGSKYSPNGRIIVIENGIPANSFRKLDKVKCRKKFGLPIEGKIIGTAGALAASRGIGLLFEAFSELLKSDHYLHLALAGKIGSSIKLPKDHSILYLGELSHSEMPEFYNCLDVAVVCNLESSFGKYCYPQKISEIQASEVPVVVANVGDMSILKEMDPGSVYEPNDLPSLQAAIVEKLARPRIKMVSPHTWAKLANKLDSFISEIANKRVHCL
jgi:glycosyltransferase involved in cell wall biosynthesis